MDLLIYLAEAWWPLYAVHFVEVSLFILLVWAVDRWMTLDTRLRYVLYLLALAKVFVPPFYAIPLPELLTVSKAVPVGPVYTDVVSEVEFVAPVQVAPLPLVFYLFFLWGVSVAVWAGVTLWKNAAFHRALRLAVPVDLAREVESLDEARNIKVYAKASLRSPLLVGIVKPRLYLPSHWSSWSSEELRGIVAHELAHRDNRDIWVLIFQGIAMALFCVNPLVWLLNRRLAFLRELRCDEAVLRETNLTPAEYGRLLFGFVDRRPALSALYFNERGTALKKRLEYVLNFKEDNVKRSNWQLAIPILIGLAIVPFSIREAYTQDEGGVEVIELAEDEKKLEPTPEQQTSLSASGDADSSKVLEFFMVEVKPKVLHSVKPVHPEEALRDSLEGKVFVKFIVNVDGSVSNVRVLRGPEVFHQAAIDAVSQFRFKPAEHNGKPVAVWMTQPVTFRLPKKQSTPPVPVDVDSDGVLEFFMVEVKPKVLHAVKPVHPEEALRDSLEGKVFLKFMVNVDGLVSDVSVLRGPEVFHQAAIDGISQYRFKSAEHNGKPVAVWLTQPVSFRLPKQQIRQSRQSSRNFLRNSSKHFRIVKGFSNEVMTVFEVEVKPRLLHSVEPVYPKEALEDKVEGFVLLQYMVNVDGSVSDVSVLIGSNTIERKEFQQAAINAVSQFRYKPAEHNGKPIAVLRPHAVAFRLPKE